jgi:RNA polymerase sigma factor (sigma-70 family)
VVRHRDPDPGVAAIVGGIARADPAALATLYESWFDRAFDTARALTRRDESFCMDVVQDALLRAIRYLRPALGIRTGEDLDRWMTRVVHSTALDHLRREKRRLARHQRRAADARSDGSHPSDEAGLAEDIAWLRSELSRLDERDRELLGHRFGRERTLEDSGAAAGLTGPAAHGRIRRALARLRAAAREIFDES